MRDVHLHFGVSMGTLSDVSFNPRILLANPSNPYSCVGGGHDESASSGDSEPFANNIPSFFETLQVLIK
jgi:hypothetical protein